MAAAAIDSPAESQKIDASGQPNPSTSQPPRVGPTANPIGPDAPKIAMIVPIRWRGTTSRIAPSMIPVLPSWNPMRRRLTASCHGSRDSATHANTTASTRQLLTTTALRLYLSAHTPHNGTSGIPTMNSRAEKMPTNGARSASGTPTMDR